MDKGVLTERLIIIVPQRTASVLSTKLSAISDKVMYGVSRKRLCRLKHGAVRETDLR